MLNELEGMAKRLDEWAIAIREADKQWSDPLSELLAKASTALRAQEPPADPRVAELTEGAIGLQDELLRMAQHAMDLEDTIAALKDAGDGLAEWCANNTPHVHGCDVGNLDFNGDEMPCDCGRNEALKAWKALTND